MSILKKKLKSKTELLSILVRKELSCRFNECAAVAKMITTGVEEEEEPSAFGWTNFFDGGARRTNVWCRLENEKWIACLPRGTALLISGRCLVRASWHQYLDGKSTST